MRYATDVVLVQCDTCGDRVQRGDAEWAGAGYECRSCHDPERFARRVQAIEDTRRGMGRAA